MLVRFVFVTSGEVIREILLGHLQNLCCSANRTCAFFDLFATTRTVPLPYPSSFTRDFSIHSSHSTHKFSFFVICEVSRCWRSYYHMRWLFASTASDYYASPLVYREIGCLRVVSGIWKIRKVICQGVNLEVIYHTHALIYQGCCPVQSYSVLGRCVFFF